MAVEDEQVTPVVARIYTDFFKRDPQMYALGDIRFNKPKSLKSVGYTLALFFIYGFPMMMLVTPARMISGPFWLLIVIGPPIGLGTIMGKPLFHNKPLMKDLKSLISYNGEAKIYTDLIEYDYIDVDTVEVGDTAWIADSDCYEEEWKAEAERRRRKGSHRGRNRKTSKKD